MSADTLKVVFLKQVWHYSQNSDLFYPTGIDMIYSMASTIQQTDKADKNKDTAKTKLYFALYIVYNQLWKSDLKGTES